MAPLSNENTHRPYGVVGIEDELEFDSDYYGNDYDRPGAEGMNDLAEIYYDYYFNDKEGMIIQKDGIRMMIIGIL